MPKHVPTFKHLLHTPLTPQRSESKESKSVNDLLATSRILRPSVRDVPPHIIASGERVWTPPTSIASGSGGGGGLGLIDVEEGGVHPAELLRRSRISHRQASRSVAGPAPPPSWRASQSSSTSSTSATLSSSSKHVPSRPVSTSQLAESSSLFATSKNSLHSHVQKPRLVELCFRVVLRHLEDEEIIYVSSSGEADDEETTEVPGWREEEGREEQYTLGRVLREQVSYLEPHLKSALLATASILPESHPSRLTDQSFLSILADPPPDDDSPSPTLNHDHTTSSSPEDEVDWDTPLLSSNSTTFTQLPITLHPSPHTLLRQIPMSTSLTSLNLAYSTLPSDLDKLVSVLPPGLRELGMAGVKFGSRKSGAVGEDTLRRGFGALGRKLIVLTMLDISFPRFELTFKLLISLLHPASSHLPSLRRLGLRGYLSPVTCEVTADEAGDVKVDGVNGVTSSGTDEARKSVVEIVRGGGRMRYVEIVW
ncbi:hypothetical protein CI109_105029 [Kwoniella shandongensis]|uniref:Uncharacterized protein n=1 Tax=Kwoniella shandongensis TaxID=1734106 RepID=A0A5M6BZU3_9TREE|nr:uncharacterized protein CI109_004372 [Kwoniella shandongensis]KAA5527312.1 hypothetical protein CI109_004372 [Kwoniella shandongensis]